MSLQRVRSADSLRLVQDGWATIKAQYQVFLIDNKNQLQQLLGENYSTHQAMSLYKAKIRDLNLYPNLQQFKIFYQSIARWACKNILHLCDQQLGRHSSQVISCLINSRSSNSYNRVLLDFNPLGDAGLMTISKALSRSQIIFMSLKNCGITAQGIEKFTKQAQQNTCLVAICLANQIASIRNKPGLRGCQLIGQFIQYRKMFMHLDLEGCNIGSSGFNVLCKGLINNTSLVFINLKGNDISQLQEFSLEWLSSAKIQTVNLNDNSLKNSTLKSLSQNYRSIPSSKRFQIKRLILAKNKFNFKGLQRFLHILQDSQALESLDLSFNNLQKVDFQTIIVNSPNFKELILVQAKLCEQAVKKIFAGLINRQSRLKMLNLKGNMLDKSVPMLAQCFSSNPQNLNELTISHCQISDQTGSLLARSLFNHKSMNRLDISYNFLAKESSRSFSQLVRNNNNIKQLNLKKNLIQPANNSTIQRLLNFNRLKGQDNLIGNLKNELRWCKQKFQSTKVISISDSMTSLADQIVLLQNQLKQKTVHLQTVSTQLQAQLNQLKAAQKEEEEKYRTAKAALLSESSMISRQLEDLQLKHDRLARKQKMFK